MIMKTIMKKLDDGTLVEKKFEDLNMIEKLAIREGFAKAIDVPSAFRVGGSLVAEQAISALQNVVANDTFLKAIYTHFCVGNTADLNFLKAARYGTIRPTYGSDSAVNRAITNGGNKLTLLPMQSNYFLADNVLQENLDNANFEATVSSILVKAASDDLAELAFLGTTDTPSGTAGTSAYMYTLQTGFPTLLTADATVVDATYQGTDIIALLGTMKAAMKPEFALVNDNTFFLSVGDYDKYGAQLQALNANGTAYLNGEPLKYMGKPVLPCPYLSGKAMYTSASNLVVGFNKAGMTMETERRARMAGTDMIMNYQADFGYFVGEQIVFAS
jgi:hypothetical protein